MTHVQVPLSEELFFLMTDTLELVPPKERRPAREVLDRLKETASTEDAEAIAVLEALLKGGDA